MLEMSLTEDISAFSRMLKSLVRIGSSSSVSGLCGKPTRNSAELSKKERYIAAAQNSMASRKLKVKSLSVAEEYWNLKEIISNMSYKILYYKCK